MAVHSKWVCWVHWIDYNRTMTHTIGGPSQTRRLPRSWICLLARRGRHPQWHHHQEATSAIIGAAAFLGEVLGAGNDLVEFFWLFLVGLRNRPYIFACGFALVDVIESSLPSGNFTCRTIESFWQCHVSALRSLDHLNSKCSSHWQRALTLIGSSH